MSAMIDTRPAEEFIRADREAYEAMMRGEPFFSEVVRVRSGEIARPVRKTIRVRETVGGVYTGRWAVVGLICSIAPVDPENPYHVSVVYRVARSELSGRMQLLSGVAKNPGLEILAFNLTHESFRLGRLQGEDRKDEDNRIGEAFRHRDTAEEDRRGDPDGGSSPAA